MRINQPGIEIECIPSSLIVKIMQLEQQQTQQKVKCYMKKQDNHSAALMSDRKRTGQFAGLLLIGTGGIYFIIRVLIWLVKG